MAIVTVGRILNLGRDFETRLDAVYSEIRDRSENNSVRLVTYYLACHRHHQESVLDKLDPAMLKRARRMKLKSGMPLDPETCFHLPAFTPQTITGKDLIEAAIRWNNALVSLYRTILAQHVDEDASAVMEALALNKERSIVMLKKMLAMHYF